MENKGEINMGNITAKGVNGQIEIFNNRVCITRKSVFGFLTQGLKGEKDFRISAITSIQFKKASRLFNGYIQFAFMGGQEAKGGLCQGIKDENTIVFSRKQQKAFELVRESIENWDES